MARRWNFHLENTESWIRNIATSHGSTQDFSIAVEEVDGQAPQYFFTSPWLDVYQDAQELADALAATTCLVAGAMWLYAPQTPSTNGCGPTTSPLFGGLRVDPSRALDGCSDTWLDLPPPNLAAGLSALTGTPPTRAHCLSVLDAEPVGAALFLARLDSDVQGCLLCLGYSGISYVSLYQCLDFMKQNWAVFNWAMSATGTTKKTMERFTHTANVFSAAGPSARHGGQGVPPAKPMSVEEAGVMLLAVLREFVASRLKDPATVTKWNTLGE